MSLILNNEYELLYNIYHCSKILYMLSAENLKHTDFKKEGKACYADMSTVVACSIGGSQ